MTNDSRLDLSVVEQRVCNVASEQLGSGSGAGIGLLTTSTNDLSHEASSQSTIWKRAFEANAVVVGSGLSNCAVPHPDVDEYPTLVVAA